ncbi:hypothetical protein KC865_03340 [Candidatus Kaiserbacteria bacterium]|nr:hypothetical protein [Candidatus Kaiserbacteria bacterium]USN92598.1 MAG: hypothetical protein H6782_02170 [Candidatus Nomurabacteria bacterium]
METSNDDYTTEELSQILDFLAKKFALLLAISDLDEEIQEALISALPHLKLSQIINLVNKLEAKYANSKMTTLDEEMEAKLKQITDSFYQRQADRDEELQKELSNLSATLN